MRDKQEVEIVDFLLQVKECLVCESFNSHPSVFTHSIPPLILPISPYIPLVKGHPAVSLSVNSDSPHSPVTDQNYHFLST